MDCDFVANQLSKSVEEESGAENNEKVCYSMFSIQILSLITHILLLYFIIICSHCYSHV